MKFTAVANVIWLGCICLFLAVFLVGAGMPLGAVVLVVGGCLVMFTGSHWALAKSRAARGKPDSLVTSLDDLVHLGARGWLVTLACGAMGGGLALAGVLLAAQGGA